MKSIPGSGVDVLAKPSTLPLLFFFRLHFPLHVASTFFLHVDAQMSSYASSLQEASSSYQYTTLSRPRTGRPRTARPRTGLSTLAGIDAQKIVCAISESRGVSPTVGLAFVNLDTCEAVLCQICDSQTYVRTVQKIAIFGPSELLIMQTAAHPKSKLYSIIEENLEDLDCTLTLLDRRYFKETAGLDYIRDLAFHEDVDTVQSALTGKFYAVSCFAAVKQDSILILSTVLTNTL